MTIQNQTIEKSLTKTSYSPATLCVVVILGVILLHRLAGHVARQSVDPPMKLAGISESEVLAIYAPVKLMEFAREKEAFTSNDELALALRAANLGNCWYAIDIADTMEDGTIQELTRVVYPGKDRQQFVAASVVLSALAGKPKTFPKLDYRPAEIVVIDDSYIGADPFQTMKDLDEIRVASRSHPSQVSHHIGFHTQHSHEDD